MSKEALKLALEALEKLTNAAEGFSVSGVYFNEELWARKCLDDAYDAMGFAQEALAQPEHHTLTSRVNDVRFHKERDEQRAEAMKMLAQPEQEPVAWVNWCAATGKRSVSFECESELASQPLYSGITQITQDRYSNDIQQRKPLTDEQIEEICWTEMDRRLLSFARAIEAAHGIKE